MKDTVMKDMVTKDITAGTKTTKFRAWKRRFLVIAMLLGVFTFSACMDDWEELEYDDEYYDDEESAQENGSYGNSDEAGDWVIYWYLCGSDLESEGGSGTDDLIEMMQVSLPEEVTVVIQTGGSSAWMNEMVDPTKMQRYLYTGEELTLIEELPQGNMGDEDTFVSFLEFCQQGYPADKQMLLFWNHGGGSVGGVAFDENYDYDALLLPEIESALSRVYENGTNPFAIVGFDACHMATLEMAQVLSGYASYMVASQEYEPAIGWSYDVYLEELAQNPDMGASELGRVICDSYYARCQENGLDGEATLSVVDIHRLPELMQAFGNMSAELLEEVLLNPQVCGEFARSAQNAENYGGNNEWEGYLNMVDLGDLVENAAGQLPDTASAILAALQEVVVYQVNGAYRQGAKGLSVYYPYSGDYQEIQQYAEYAASDNYVHFASYLTGNEVSEEVIASLPEVDYEQVEYLSTFSDDMPVTITEEYYAQLAIDPVSLASVKSVLFNLSYYDEEEEVFIFLGRDNDLYADWETGLFEDNFREIWVALDGSLCYMEITYEGDFYNLYSVPIYHNGVESVLRVAYDFDEAEYQILGVRAGNEFDVAMGDKNLYMLEEGDQVIPILYGIYDWDDAGEVYEFETEEVVVTADTAFYEVELMDGEYAFMFEVVDTSNQSFYSEAVYFTYEGGEVYYLEEE